MNKYKRITGRNNTCPRNDEDLLNLVGVQWEEFRFKNGKYPTSQEINDDQTMITTRTIERRLGGLKEIRSRLGHEILNYSSGSTRSITASDCMANSVLDEILVSNFLYEKFGKRPHVIKQETYNDTDVVRSDAGIYHSNGHFFIDVFSAKDTHSFKGCINHKFNKIKNKKVNDNIYYISGSKNISQEEINKIIKNKKIKLYENITVLTFDNFKLECKKFKPRVDRIL